MDTTLRFCRGVQPFAKLRRPSLADEDDETVPSPVPTCSAEDVLLRSKKATVARHFVGGGAVERRTERSERTTPRLKSGGRLDGVATPRRAVDVAQRWLGVSWDRQRIGKGEGLGAALLRVREK
ncbi:hypothetical protein PIB30_044853 [Stylosanthes scabra]|uniref:Uncharacterized protein n=1 Tax=Stylosanthes scabra TaxID=79078 RepID=A0ABU6ZEQ9_9FABA|nr:hypothetical protein [Stylosanthes scabra]